MLRKLLAPLCALLALASSPTLAGPPAIPPSAPTCTASQACTPNSVVVGAPTGGNQGAGTINATAIYIQGTSVGTSTGTVSVHGATPTAGDCASFYGSISIQDVGYGCGAPAAVTPTGIPNVCTATYCIDSINGSDSNTGAPGSPWQTPCSASSTSARLGYGTANGNTGCGTNLTAGQSVQFACNSVFRRIGSNATAIINVGANNVSIGAYNPGPYACSQALQNTPIFNASDIIPNANFTSVGGSYPNVYTVSITFVNGGGSAWANMWETGATTDSATGQFLSLQTSETNVNSTACSYYVPGMTSSSLPTGSVTVYVHSCDGSNPISNGYTYEIAQGTGIAVNGTTDQVYNVQGHKNGTNDGSIVGYGSGYADYFYGLILRDGGKHNTILPSGSTIANSWTIDSYYNSSGSGGSHVVFHQSSSTGLSGNQLGINVINDVCETTQLIANNGSQTCYISHTDDSTSLGPIFMSNDWMIAKNSTVLSGTGFVNTGNGTANNLYADATVNPMSVYQNWTITNSQFVTATITNNPIYITVSNNTISFDKTKFCGTGSQGFIRYSGSLTSNTINITNSVWYGRYPASGNGALFVYNPSGNTGNTFYFYNNDFGSNVQYFRSLYDLGSSNTFSTASNNNIYESATYTPYWSLNNTSYSTLAAWQSAVSTADTYATEAGGDAAAACILPPYEPSIN